jgi:serine/threonine-protein kinase
MYERFSDRARKVMQLASQEAQRFNHPYIGTEHILLGLVKEGSGVAASVLKNLVDINLQKIRLEIEKIVRAGPDMVTMAKLPQTPRAKKVIEYAIEEARSFNHNEVDGIHLLLGLLREPDGAGGQVLRNLGLKLADAREEMLALLSSPASAPIPGRRTAPEQDVSPPSGTSASSCPAPARLLRLLNAALPEEEQAPLMEHLEGCAGCREALEALAAGRDSWAGVARSLRGETGPERTRSFPSAGGSSLDFLDPPAKPGQLGKLAHYEILETIGRGGMGVVLKGFDQTLHRVVAVKVMAPELAASGTARDRFLREARAAAAVAHDHVVTIHAVDEAKGLPYLVMQYIHGESLQQKLDRAGPLELKEILRIGVQAADGLAAAHAQGLIHRDIKPANILLENGVQRVKITDFGLARAVDDASVTQSGVIAGTPQYMSPEQALGEPQDYRTDLFSLGSVLYTLCTGRPPFRAPSALAVLHRVAEDTPRPVREVNPEVPDWLESIVEKLMEKHPVDRFQSAAEVARLLEGHLAHLQQPGRIPRPEPAPPAKRPPPPVATKAAKKAGVAFWLLLAAGVLCLGCCVLPAGLMMSYYGVSSDSAPPVPSGTVVFGGEPPTLLPRIPLQTGKGGLTCVALDRDGKQLAAGYEDGDIRVYDLATQKFITLNAPAPGIRSLVFGPGGTTLYSGGGGKRKPDSPSNEVVCWELNPAKQVRTFDWPPGQLNTLALSPDGKWLAAGGENGVMAWDVLTGKDCPVPAGLSRVLCVAFSADNSTAAAAGEDKVIQLWEVASGIRGGQLQGHTEAVWALCFQPNGEALVSAGMDHTVRLWDFPTRQIRGVAVRWLPGGSWVRALACSRNGAALVMGLSNQQAMVLFDPIANWNREPTLLASEQGQEVGGSVAVAADGKLLATGHRDGTIRLWDVSSSPPGVPPVRVPDVEPKRDLRPPPEPKASFRSEKRDDLWCVAINRDETAVAAGFGDGKVVVWDVATGKKRVLDGHKLPVRAVAFTADGKRLLTGAGDYRDHERGGEVKVWHLPDEATTESNDIPWDGGPVFAVAVSPDGKTMAAGGAAGVKVWDAPNQRKRLVPEQVRGAVFSLAFSPDGQRVAAAGSFQGDIFLWNSATGKDTVILKGHTDEIESVCFHPDGRTLASGGRDGMVRIWDLRTGGSRMDYEMPPKSWVRSVAFSGDGGALVVGTYDHTVSLCDPARPRMPVRLSDPEREFGGEVAFAPGGKLLVTRNMNGVVRLWELGGGKPATPPVPVGKTEAVPPPEPKVTIDIRDSGLFAGHRGLLCVALSNDEKTLAAGFEDGGVLVCDVATRNPIKLSASKFPVRSLAFTPEGTMLLTGAGELPKPKAAGELKLLYLDGPKKWEATSYDVGDLGPVSAVAVSPDGRTIVAGGDAGIKWWDVRTGAPGEPKAAVKGVRSLAFAPNSQYLAVVGERAVVNVYDTQIVQDWVLWPHAMPYEHRCETVCYGPNGKTLGLGYGDGMVKLWGAKPEDVWDPAASASFRVSEKAAVRSLASWRSRGKDAGGRRVYAIGLSDETVKLIDANDPAKPIDFPRPGEEAGGKLAVSPEGNYLVTAHRNGVIKLWEGGAGMPAVPSAKEEAKKDIEKLQGVWQEGAIDAIAFFDNRFSMYELGKVTLAGTFEIVDATSEPRQMDLFCTEGTQKGKRLQAIYKFDDERLEIHHGDWDGQRPKGFSERVGYHRILKRKNP